MDILAGGASLAPPAGGEHWRSAILTGELLSASHCLLPLRVGSQFTSDKRPSWNQCFASDNQCSESEIASCVGVAVLVIEACAFAFTMSSNDPEA
jgi:hypothetical protein